MQKLETLMADWLAECSNKGMCAPYVVIVVGVNGSLLAARYVCQESGGGLDIEMLAEHKADDLMRLPINVMLVDSLGAAARMVIEKDRVTYH